MSLETKQPTARRWPHAIAIVGLACRVPGAKSAEAFWRNLLAEHLALHEFSAAELQAAGVDAAQLADPRYVRVAPVLDDFDRFDAGLFGYSPREAAWMDPNQRVFLETAWEALEDSGHDPRRYSGAIGVFAGSGGSISSYLFALADRFQSYLGGTAGVPHLGNDKDFLPTRLSYKLHLRGPAVNVQTACSTSLVAVHLACQSLLSGESDMALAGGVSIRVPHLVGYLAREGDVVSPTGRCRPFSASADGTIFGSGAGVVVLKTLQRALDDGDRIYAVIRGSAVNNDGGEKLSFTATSVAGQAACAQAALAAAGVKPATIGYVEAHGTATLLGDPLEVDALNQVYDDGVRDRCGLGSLKGNIGHLEAAAGVLGLIKAALALEREVIPASIHCDLPSPRIQFAAGPFHVVRRALPWKRSPQPRRAGVNSLGVGGTNVHVVLEEAPPLADQSPVASPAMLCLSAAQPATLVELAARYLQHFRDQPQLNWHDACFTAAAGRTILDQRLVVCAATLDEACAHLQQWLADPRPNVVLGESQLHAAVAARFVTSGEVEPTQVTPANYQPRRVKLPSYPFARDRHWLEASALAENELRSPRAVLLGEPRYSPATQETSFSADFHLAQIPFLRQHRIYERVIVPGATYLSMLLTVRGDTPGELHDVQFIRPLAIAEHDRVRLQLTCYPREHAEQFAVFTQPLSDSSDSTSWSEHVRGTLVQPTLTSHAAHPAPLAESECLDPRQIYARFRDLGLSLDATFQTIRAAQRGVGRLEAEIHAPLGDHARLWMHPAALDGCLQLVVGQLAAPDAQAELFLPLSIERLRWLRRPGAHFRCQVQPHGDHDTATETRSADLTLYDELGVFCQIDGLVVKRASRATLERSATDDAEGWLHGLIWQRAELSPSESIVAGRWLLVGDDATQCDALAQALIARGQQVVTSSVADVTRHFDGSHDAPPVWSGVVLATCPEMPLNPSHQPPEHESLRQLLHLSQRIVQHCNEPPRLWIVTCGAHAVTPDSLPLNMAGSSHWGFMRALNHEHPELRGSCLDRDPRGDGHSWSAVVDELLGNSDERQIAFRAGERFVARLQPWAELRDPKQLAVPQGAHRLQITKRGSLDQLTLNAADAPPPGPGEVRIDVSAAGLNFRDVLNTLGRYPGDPGALGMECAGRIRDLGPSVEGWQVGDRVVALAQGSLATSVTVSTALIAKLPESLTDAEAASVPVVFATAELGLRRLAQLQCGERVLIHAAAGGVGWAAIEIARRVGAEIYATASREKWDYLRRQGVRRLYDSRSLEFADQIRHDTHGAGIDVVLNSLAGEYILATLNLLALGGRFVELGKQAIWTAAQVAAMRPDVQYHVLALDQRMAHEPHETGEVLRDVFGQIATGRWQTPPLTCFPLHSAPRAMRRLQQGQHVGKCVLTCRSGEQRAIRADGSYLIVGWGGLGQVLLTWLVHRGAKRVAIVSRRAPTAQQAAQLDDLRRQGVTIVHYPADAADERQLQHALEQCRSQPGELRGVFHLAGVLDDGLLERQDAARLERVWRPKVTAAWHLHQLTRSWPIEHFVLFSSSTGVLGAAGQTNYAAANAALDALAAERHRQGLPAVSIDWGPWSGAGMAARLDDASRERWQSRGARFIAPELGTALFDRILNLDAPQIMAFRADWRRYRAHVPYDSLLAELGELPPLTIASTTHEQSQQTLAERLAHAGGQNSLPIIRAWVVEHVRSTLGWSDSREVDPDVPLADQGLDSLMAVELLHQLRGELQTLMTVPPTMLFDHPRIDDLAAFIGSRITSSRQAA